MSVYKSYSKREDGKSYSWEDVHAAIAHYAGYEVGTNQKLGAESIRKFVEGEPRKHGERHYSKPDWIPYAVEFLTHDDILVITEDELDGYISDLKAASILVDYLYDGGKKDSVIGSKSGVYYSIQKSRGEFIVTELHLENQINPFIYEAALVKYCYCLDAAEKYSTWTSKEKLDNRIAYYTSTGWAIHTPENELIVYLKTPNNISENYVNEYYSTGSEFKSDGIEKLPEGLVLLQSKSLWAPLTGGTVQEDSFRSDYFNYFDDLASVFSKNFPD